MKTHSISAWNFRFDLAPEDKAVLLATTGDHVGEAIYGEDEENPQWRWVSGVNNFLHPNLKPVAWMFLPEHPET